MNASIDKKIKKILSTNVELSDEYKYIIRNTLKNEKEKRKICYGKTFKLAIAGCSCIILTTSVVFAKDISVFFKGLFNNNSEGIDVAIQNGYFYQPDIEYIQSSNIETKMNNLLMDDSNLSFTLNLKFKDEVSVDEISEVHLPDMIIVDEESKILYCQDENIFNEFCKNNDLSLQYKNFNDYNINSGVNCFIKAKDLKNNSIDLVYNLYANNFPKSKKIILCFNKIEIEKNENSENRTTINGNWNLKVDIPEVFYNREAIVYNVKQCSNPKINVTEAIIYDTCMKISLNIQEELIYESSDSEEIINQKINEKVDEARDEYLKKAQEGDYENLSTFNSNPYVQTSDGKKFYPTKNSSEDSGTSNDFMTGIVTYWQTFNLTKYEASNTLTVYLKYKGENIAIELEKGK